MESLLAGFNGFAMAAAIGGCARPRGAATPRLAGAGEAAFAGSPDGRAAP